jgi:hypothetical protein
MASYAAIWSDPASASHTTTTTVAEAPLSVEALAGDEQASVRWNAPGSDHGATITGYTVTSSPGGLTSTVNGVTLMTVVTGLTNGVAYTFTVVATNSQGNSVASSASNSVSPVDVPTGSVLTDLMVSTSLNLTAGQVLGIGVNPVNENGSINLSMPSIVYTWTPGSCGTLDSTTSRTPIFTATSTACTGTISVEAMQGDSAPVPVSPITIIVNVAAPPATPVPTAIPTDPAVIPVIVPAGLSADDVTVILPSSGGTFSVPASGSDPAIAIAVPGGALDSGTAAAVNIVVISSADVPPPPAEATEGASSGTFKFGSTIIDIQWYDDAGTALDTFSLNRPAEICVPYSQADIDGAVGGPDGMALWRYSGSDWVQLNSSVNTGAGTVCANTSNFSSFALGLAVAAPGSAGEEAVVAPAGLPVTGDYSPGIGGLILAMLAGIALVAVGAFTARRARRVRVTS